LKKNGELPECDAVINLAGENIANPMRRLDSVMPFSVFISILSLNNTIG
jgi:hypothetical protein